MRVIVAEWRQRHGGGRRQNPLTARWRDTWWRRDHAAFDPTECVSIPHLRRASWVTLPRAICARCAVVPLSPSVSKGCRWHSKRTCEQKEHDGGGGNGGGSGGKDPSYCRERDGRRGATMPLVTRPRAYLYPSSRLGPYLLACAGWSRLFTLACLGLSRLFTLVQNGSEGGPFVTAVSGTVSAGRGVPKMVSQSTRGCATV